MNKNDFYTEVKTREKYITWAIVNDKVEWIDGRIDHKNWLKEKFNISQRLFEETISGYINAKQDGTMDVVYFKGSGLDECEIDNKHLAKVLFIADLSYDYNKICIHSGLKMFKNLNVSKSKGAYKVLSKIDTADTIVSVKSILDYEDKLVNIINSTIYSNTSIFRQELERCHTVIKEYLYSEKDLLDLEFKRRILTYLSLI